MLFAAFSSELSTQQPLFYLCAGVPTSVRPRPWPERLQPGLRRGLPVWSGLRVKRQELHPASKLWLLHRREVLWGESLIKNKNRRWCNRWILEPRIYQKAFSVPAQTAVLEQWLYQALPLHRQKPGPVWPQALQGRGRVHPPKWSARLLRTTPAALCGVRRWGL